MNSMETNIRQLTLVAVFAVAAIALALSGAAVGEILDPGAEDPSEGATLTEWEPQLVNSSTVDTYQVEIRADNETGGITLIRQRPQITSEVTQRITMNDSFGDAANPEIVAFEGDDGPQERLTKNVFIDDGDVVVTFADEGVGAQQQAKLTGVTIEFETESAPDPGFYNFSVDMQGQETLGGQTGDFETLNETGVAEVEVVDADPAGPDDLDVTDVDTATEASQDERQLEVNATIDNPTADILEDSLVYGLQEDADPAFDGTDLLTQQQNVTVGANSQETVTFFVDLTEEDEAIDTGDDITHGVALADSGSNITAPLDITDGPVEHYTDGGDTFNRTTGLIQTAVDISDDADEDVVGVSLAGSPYGENVTVDVSDIVIGGELLNGDRPAVAWAGPQPPDADVNPPFTVTGASNVTIVDLQVEPLIPEAGGIDIAGGAFHGIVNIDMEGTNTGAPGPGINVTNPTGPVAVQNNAIANKSVGVLFHGVNDGLIDNNVIQNNSGQGVLLEGGSDGNAVTNNVLSGNLAQPGGQGVIRVLSGSDNLIEDNTVADNSRGIRIDSDNNAIIGNTVTGVTASGSALFVNANNNLVADNNVSHNAGDGIRVGGSTARNDNTVVNNTVVGNNFGGIYAPGLNEGNAILNNTVLNNTGTGTPPGDTRVGAGIEVRGSGPDNTVEGNDLDGNHYGIVLVETDDGLAVTDNTVNNSDNEGIAVFDALGTMLVDNDVIDSGDTGILVQNGSQNGIVGGTVSGTEGSNGVIVDNSSGITVADTDVIDNQWLGISIDYTSGFEVDGVEVRENRRAGLQAFESENGVFRNVLSSENALNSDWTGVRARASENVLFDNVTAENSANGGNGIDITDGSVNVTVMDSAAVGNDGIGIQIMDSTDNTLTDIEAMDNGEWAYQVDNSSDNVVENLNVGDSTAANTTLSFEAENVQLRSNQTPPADPADSVSIDRFFEAQNVAADAFLDVELAYENDDVQGIDEDSLELLRHDDTEWVAVPDSGVDTAENVVVANVTEFGTFGAFGESATSELSDLDIAGEGDSAVVAEAVDHDVTVNVTNLAADGTEIDVTLTIGNEVNVTETTGPLDDGETETVVFENVTGDLLISMDAYPVTVSTDDDEITGELRVHPDVNGDDNPARDTTGDGLLNDVNGDGSFDIFDVQVLFDFLDAPVVQDNAGFFDFAGTGGDRVSIFDIQGLFTQLQAQPS